MNIVARSSGVLVVGLVACSTPALDAEAKGGTESHEVGGSYVTGTISAEGKGARIRAGTSTSTEILGRVVDGTTVSVECWSEGESIEGNTRWDYLPRDGGYVSDALVLLDGAVPPCDGKDTDAKPPAPTTSSSSFRQGLVAEARKYVGTKATGVNCNPFTPQVSTMSCRPWCADFVHVVWRDGGANVNGIDGTSMSFYNATLRTGGVWKSGQNAANVEPGDAVVWSKGASTIGEHVGMVTEVDGDQIRVIHGNFWKDGDNGEVYESTISRRDDLQTGAPIIGFASPRPR